MTPKKLKKSDIAALVLSCTALAAASAVGLLYASSVLQIKKLGLDGIEPSYRLPLILREAEDKKIRLMSNMLIAGSLGLPLMAFGGLAAAVLWPKRRELHGSARFATVAEVTEAGLLKPDSPTDEYPSVIVGRIGKQYLLFRGQQFLYLAAPTRSGKGVGVVIPNLLHYRDSVVVLDIKEENFLLTAGYRAQCGQEIYKFAPDAEDFVTHRWNPLTYVRHDPRYRLSDLMGITSKLWRPNPEDVWGPTATGAFLGLALYCMETAKERDNFNIPYIKRLFTSLTWLENEETCRTYIKSRQDYEPLSAECCEYLIAFARNEGKVRNSIQVSFDAPLLVFGDPITAKAVSASDFNFRDVRRKRMSIYVCIKPGNIDRYGILLNLFFEQLLAQNLDTLPQDDPSLKYQCLLVMDEFTAMGRVSIIEKGSAFMAGYNMRLLLIFQSLAQVQDEKLYGKTGARTMLTNMALQILYAPREDADAEDYSTLLGFMTEKGVSRSTQVGLGRGGASVSVSDQRRAVLLPQEVKAIGQDAAIISMENMLPALVEKIRYWKEPVFNARVKKPVPLIPCQEDLPNVIEAAPPSPVIAFAGNPDPLPLPPGATFEIGFSPNRNALEVIMSLILSAKHELFAAAYSFTNKEMAHAFAECAKRGVDTQIVVDHEQNSDDQGGYKAIDYMAANGVTVHRSKNYAAMHHKFIVVDGVHVEFGSINYTAAGMGMNAENAVVFRNCQQLAEYFRNEFLRLITEPQVGTAAIIAADRGLAALKKLGI